MAGRGGPPSPLFFTPVYLTFSRFLFRLGRTWTDCVRLRILLFYSLPLCRLTHRVFVPEKTLRCRYRIGKNCIKSFRQKHVDSLSLYNLRPKDLIRSGFFGDRGRWWPCLNGHSNQLDGGNRTHLSSIFLISLTLRLKYPMMKWAKYFDWPIQLTRLNHGSVTIVFTAGMDVLWRRFDSSSLSVDGIFFISFDFIRQLASSS